MQVNPQRQQLLVLILGILFAAGPAYCSTYYVDPNGNDTTGNGSIGLPWKTIPTAVTAAVAGDTIYVRGGNHVYATTISISKSGTSGAKFYLFAYPGEKPILNFSSMADADGNRGIILSGSYWHFKGINIYGAGDNGMNMSGSNNIIELCTFYENRDSGLQLGGGAANNQIINCDSYYNRDSTDGNADGFSPKMDVGTGNYFYGCRSWNNSDDAYDGYLRGADDVTTTYENCWAMKAGYLKSGAAGVGNGNGFKMGGSDAKDLRHNVTLKNCLAFQNLAKGFDQNSDKGDMILYNCTAFNNGGNNFAIATSPLATGKIASVTNSTYLTGASSLGSFVVQTTNDWTTTSADFVSIDPAAAYGPRKADGSLPDITFMHLAATSTLIDAGTDVGLTYCGTAPDIGCFEYCTGGTPGLATNPTPANSATGVSLTQDLSWTAGTGATSHDVYFGTVNPPPAMVNQTGTTYDTGTMTQGRTYYWRIDEVNSVGVTTGTLWSFTTVPPPPPGAASNPTPANGATGVSTTQDLSWTAGSGATSHDVYFGTVNPPPSIGNQTAATYDTGTMAHSKTYYWRIDEKNAGGTTTGTVWNFTTLADTTAPTPNPMTWATVPTTVSSTSITMTATTATDATGPVQYYFECTTDAGKSSSWQTGTTYVATGLTPSTLYSFRVKARDSAPALNETGWSSTLSATTLDPIPTFVAAGTGVSGTGNITVAWPTHIAGDVALLFVESTGGQAATLGTPAGFVNVTGSPQSTGTTTNGTRITVYWCRATSSSMTSPIVTDPGDHAYGRILTFRGVVATGNPWDVTAGGIKSTASTTTTFGTVTTTVNNTLIVLAASRDNDATTAAWSAWTNANLSSLIEQADGGTTSGNGGGFGVATGGKAAAGAIGSTTATVTSSVDGHITIALKPEVVSPPGASSVPTPTNGATGVSLTQDLIWTAGSGATSHDVYFGTVNPPPMMQNQVSTTYDTGTMAYSTTYYWRIDEKNAGGTTTGTVWSFTTIPLPVPGVASNPTPANSAINVGLTQDLSWTAGSNATSHDVYFGTAASPPFIGNQTGITYDTGTMAYSTVYYWRIDEKNTSGTTTGTVWSFTTQADTSPPAAPTGLTATAGYIPVKLDWNDNGESDLAGYNVYRSITSGSGYSKLNGILLTDSNYIDDINTTDITYYYVVTAVDTTSNESNYSSQVYSGLYGDFTGNKIVKLDDLAEFVTYWLLENCTATAGVDLNGDCIVNFDEFAAFADNWLK